MTAKSNSLVFIVENNHFNEEQIRKNFSEDHAHEFVYFLSSTACLAQLHRHPIAVLIDHEAKSIDPNERDALKILQKIKELDHHTEVVFFSKTDNKVVAQDTIRHGAYDYITENDNSFLQLRKALSNIEILIRHKKSTMSYRLWLWACLILCVLFIGTMLLLYYNGFIHEQGTELLGP